MYVRLWNGAKCKIKRQPTPQNIQNYRRLHAAARKIHKLAKRTAWRNYISKISPKTKPKEIWRIIRNFKGLKNTKRSSILHYNTVIHNIQEKSEIFVRNYQQTMHRQIINYPHEHIQLIDRTANSHHNETYNQRFKMHELENAIETLPTDKACGVNYIHNQFLIHLSQNKRMHLL